MLCIKHYYSLLYHLNRVDLCKDLVNQVEPGINAYSFVRRVIVFKD